MRSLISLKAIGFITALACAGPAVGQSTVNLSFDQARQLSFNLLQDGNGPAALSVADGLIEADPNDRTAWMLRAGALRLMQQPKLSRQAAATAYGLSETPAHRYEAARLAAVANADEGRFSWAQFWLRLARQYAPDEDAENRIAVEYRQLRRLNPWAFSASFGIAPSANINGGSASNTAYLDDSVDPGFADLLAALGIYDPETGLRLLGDNERALSGFEGRLSFGAQYRLNASETSATFLSANLGINRYRLSDEAQELSPTSENGDFNRDSVSVGVQHIRSFAEGTRPTSFSFGMGKNWYGSDPSNRYLTASVSQPLLMSERDLLTLGFSSSVSASFDDDIPVRTFGLTAQLLTILNSGDRVRSSIGVTKSNSSIEDSDYISLSTGVRYSFAEPILGTGVSLRTDMRFSDIGDTRFAPFDREDVTLSVGADISVPAAEVFGFQPVISLLAEKTESTVEQFDSEGTSIGLDFRSSF